MLLALFMALTPCVIGLRLFYEVLLGTSDGPPFGGFIDTYGADETADLIEKALEK